MSADCRTDRLGGVGNDKRTEIEKRMGESVRGKRILVSVRFLMELA